MSAMATSIVTRLHSAACRVFTMRSLFLGILLSSLASAALAQQKPKSHEQCIKEVPGDWGPNFGDEWHRNEAHYWACRHGVTVETIQAWQRAADEQDMASEIKPVIVAGQELVLFVKDGGTANCYGLSVLRQVGSDWINASGRCQRGREMKRDIIAPDPVRHSKPQRRANSSP